MPSEKEWASMSKAERAAYADTSGGPGGSFSGKSYPEYGHEAKAAKAYHANEPMENVLSHLNKGWEEHDKMMNKKGYKNLAHKQSSKSK